MYVDSGSTDGSVQWARDHGADVIELDMQHSLHGGPRAQCRFRDACGKMIPISTYVQFVDGDCELIEGWPEDAYSFLTQHADVGAVCGRDASVTPSVRSTTGYATGNGMDRRRGARVVAAT